MTTVTVVRHALEFRTRDGLRAAEGNRRARRKMSDGMWLATQAAGLCLAGVPAGERARLPVFFACPTGVEVTAPYLAAAKGDAGRSAPQWHSHALAGNAGNVLDYLKHSVGNTPGHVAELCGLRGMNACFTGFSADFAALRKAHVLLTAGAIDDALIVAGEAPWTDDRAESGAMAVGCALRLARDAGSRRAAPRLVIGRDGRVGPVVEPRFANLEASGCVADLACLLEANPRPEGLVCFVREDRWGRQLEYGLDWSGVQCAA